VYLNRVVVEPRGQGGQAALDQAGVVGREVDAVQEVGAVAAVHLDGRWPAVRGQGGGDRGGAVEGGSVLVVGRADAGRARRVEVHQQPAAAQHVAVAGGQPRVQLVPVGIPGEQGRVDLAEGDVDPRALAVQAERTVGQGPDVVEV